MSSLFPVSGKNNRAVPQARFSHWGSSMADLLLLEILQGRCVGRRGRQGGSDSGFWFLAQECRRRRRRLLMILVLPAYTHDDCVLICVAHCFCLKLQKSHQC